jgi:hypothetical protein
MAWVRALRFEQPAQESTRLDYLHEVEHMGERVKRLEQAIRDAVKLAAPVIQTVIAGLQALRGVAELSAVTIVSELGSLTRFAGPRQLMAYSGTVPSEDSSGKRTRRGGITKTGNAHLRRIAVESAWSYRLRPGVGPELRRAPARRAGGDQGDRLEGSEPPAQALCEAEPGGKRSAQDRHRRGPRTARLHLGHRSAGGGCRATNGSGRMIPLRQRKQRTKTKDSIK